MTRHRTAADLRALGTSAETLAVVLVAVTFFAVAALNLLVFQLNLTSFNCFFVIFCVRTARAFAFIRAGSPGTRTDAIVFQTFTLLAVASAVELCF